ncbi:MAG: carboxypeptidase-like regulatory domain-containing protein [Hyphomicrobium sp.]
MPTSPTPIEPPKYTLRGSVGEYGSSNLNNTTPIAGVSVSIVDGPNAGTSAMSDASGQYSIPGVLAGTFNLRAALNGYQTQERSTTLATDMTVNFVMVRDCSPWPSALAPMMARMSLVSNLCLVRWPSNQASNYVASQRVVYYRSPSPVGGELAAIAHELCHVHQHRVILDSGRSDPAHDGEFVPAWTETAEGRSFVELTGWRLGSPGGQAPGFGWVEACERWSCGYANPIEDNAEACAYWSNPGNDAGRGKQPLQEFAPRRAEWMRRWLPY